MNYHNIFPTILFIMFLSQIGMAQDVRMNLIWEEEDTAFFSGNLHRVKCEFTTNADRQVKLIIKAETPLKLLSPSSYKINAKKEVSNTSSIKIYLPQTGDSSKDSLSFEITVQSMEDQSILGKERLCLEIKERIKILLEPVRSQVPIKASDTIALIPIRVKNMGKRKYNVRIALENKPQGLKVKESEMVFIITPKKDTLINFDIQPDKNWKKVNSAYLKYSLTVLKTKEKVADCTVSAFPMGHVKKFYFPNFTINNTHEFGLKIQSRGVNQNTLEFFGNGKSPVLKGILNYQLQSFYYSDLGQFNLSNSFLNYYTNRQSITVGHVSYNDEVSLSGRGITYEIEKDSQFIHLGIINGSYKLFDHSLALKTQTGMSFVGGYHKTFPRLGLIESNGIFRFRESSNTGLFWITNTIIKNRNYLNLRLGLSGEQDKIYSSKNSFRTGITFSADYEKEAEAWTFQSSNHFSTSSYSGNIPGNLFTNNRLEFFGWNPVNIEASAQLQKNKSFVIKDPEVRIRYGDIFKYQFQFETAQIGQWRIILTPSQLFDHRNFIDLSHSEDFYTGKSSRLKMTLNRKKGNFSLLWKGDIGTFKFGKQGSLQKQFLFYGFGFNLSTKNLGFNTTYSRGSTLLSNAIKYEQNETLNTNFQLTVRWGKWFLGKKLKVNFSNRLAYNNFRKQWNNSCAFKIKYVLPKNITLNTEFVVFNTGNYSDIYWSMKVVKKIGNYRPPTGTKNLKLILFEDLNTNGVRENQERTLPGIFVQVDGIPFVSEEGGWIQYKSVPTGEYTINTIDPTGELAGNHQKIMVESNTEMHIPLFKTIPINGKVKEIKVRFKSSKFELIGIPIIAKNVQEEVFTTYTQPDGSFAFNLPENEYTVYIDVAAFDKNFEFPDNFQKIVLTQNIQEEISLSVKVKSRNMTIQKF